MLAEQQRARSEIEAALTIAAARPRDEKEALDRVLTSCQRQGVAEEAEYEYSRGGTAITGPTIKLLELVAQHWGNLEFGFRELARYPGIGGQPGESVVEAFAWDLQSNTRRKVSFTVQHAMKAGGRTKTLTDPRDVYEYIANQAQRRVRTCLENIIPRDIVDTACDQCRETLRTKIQITPETIGKLLDGFAKYGVSKEAIEARLQRRIDTITPAQMVQFRRIYASLRDGMSKPEDWFSIQEQEVPKTVMDKAKDALRKKQEPKPEPPKTEPEPPTPPQEAEPESPTVTDQSFPMLDDYAAAIQSEAADGKLTPEQIEKYRKMVASEPYVTEEQRSQLLQLLTPYLPREVRRGRPAKQLFENTPRPE